MLPAHVRYSEADFPHQYAHCLPMFATSPHQICLGHMQGTPDNPILGCHQQIPWKNISNFKQHVFPLQAHLLCRLSFSCKQPTITQFCVSLGTWIGVMSPTSSTNPMAGEPWQLWWRSLRIPFSCWATRMEASAAWKRMEPLRRDRPMLD